MCCMDLDSLTISYHHSHRMADKDAQMTMDLYDFDPDSIGISYCPDKIAEYGQFVDVEIREGENEITLSFDDVADVKTLAQEMLEVIERIESE